MLELIGLVAGLLIGAFFPWTIPAQWSLYVAAGLLAALDSALGGFRARVKGIKSPYHSFLFRLAIYKHICIIRQVYSSLI